MLAIFGFAGTAGAAAYERLLARCYDALHAARRDVNVLDSTASAHDPGRFLRALGRAYEAFRSAAATVAGGRADCG